MPLVDQSIWAHRGATSPIATRGRSQVCSFDSRPRTIMMTCRSVEGQRCIGGRREGTYHPEDDEEDDEEDRRRPRRNDCAGPKERPIPSVRSRQPVVAEDLGDEPPKDELAAKECLDEVRHRSRQLTVVVRLQDHVSVRVEGKPSEKAHQTCP